MADANEMTLSVFESRFKNRQYIGSGGFAKVYKAFDHAKNHYVALKVADVRPEWKQFTLQREVELVNKLPPHPNVARYDACYRFDMGVAGEIDFAILKFYEEGNLEQFIEKGGLTPEDFRIIIKGILRGVSFLHNNNYVHRDLKSQNILIQRDNGVWTPKITDFGLSRSMGTDSTANNSAIGMSYAYAAPEQIQNRKIYKNVDIWSVGVIIYRIIAGELPFKSNRSDDYRDTQSQLELSRKIVNVELPEKLNEIEEPYQAIIRRCLIADPKERCQSAEELLSLLDGEKPFIGNFEEEEEPEKKEENFQPTLFVPVEPEKRADEEKTAVIPPPPAPAMPKVPTPVAAAAPGIQPQPEYSMPKPDYTQIIEPVRQTLVAPPTSPQPERRTLKSGEPGRKFNYLWVLLPLVLLAAAFLTYLLFGTEKQSKQPPSGSFIPVPTLDELKTQNEAAIDDPVKLSQAASDIELSISRHPDDYRHIYELAKNKAYGQNNAEAFEQLKNTAITAIDYNHSKYLLQDLRRDKEQVFSQLSRGNPVMWGQLLKSIKDSDKFRIKGMRYEN